MIEMQHIETIHRIKIMVKLMVANNLMNDYGWTIMITMIELMIITIQ